MPNAWVVAFVSGARPAAPLCQALPAGAPVAVLAHRCFEKGGLRRPLGVCTGRPRFACASWPPAGRPAVAALDVRKGRPKLHIGSVFLCRPSIPMCNLERPFRTSRAAAFISGLQRASRPSPLGRVEALPLGAAGFGLLRWCAACAGGLRPPRGNAAALRAAGLPGARRGGRPGHRPAAFGRCDVAKGSGHLAACGHIRRQAMPARRGVRGRIGPSLRRRLPPTSPC